MNEEQVDVDGQIYRTHKLGTKENPATQEEIDEKIKQLRNDTKDAGD